MNVDISVNLVLNHCPPNVHDDIQAEEDKFLMDGLRVHDIGIGKVQRKSSVMDNVPGWSGDP